MSQHERCTSVGYVRSGSAWRPLICEFSAGHAGSHQCGTRTWNNKEWEASLESLRFVIAKARGEG